LSGLHSTGLEVASELMPDPFGPRNRDQSLADTREFSPRINAIPQRIRERTTPAPFSSNHN